ncbi:hypothetical protein ACFYZ3_18070 [Streptomyces sp. NPDC001599]|uniref:oxidoreductase n=1 Tax=Streptomyces sp. NPDC001599 TaxID=3364591 RepID=UPI0036D149A7
MGPCAARPTPGRAIRDDRTRRGRCRHTRLRGPAPLDDHRSEATRRRGPGNQVHSRLPRGFRGSPQVNKRTDQWGGSLRNRARLLLDVVTAVRERVSPGFGIAVKLNSADFQRGGFDLEDAHHVIEWLSDSVDFVELSGGSVESLATAGHTADDRTLEREAYFLELAGELVEAASVPLMLTGGTRRARVAKDVMARGFSLVGVATALAQRPDAPLSWLAGEDGEVAAPRSAFRSKSLRAAAVQASITSRLHARPRPFETTTRPGRRPRRRSIPAIPCDSPLPSRKNGARLRTPSTPRSAAPLEELGGISRPRVSAAARCC